MKIDDNPEVPVKPMLNSPSDAETAGNQWLQKVMSLLRGTRTEARKLNHLFNMSDEEPIILPHPRHFK
jgi:hypothetical protein